jgi:hypothetical protein
VDAFDDAIVVGAPGTGAGSLAGGSAKILKRGGTVWAVSATVNPTDFATQSGARCGHSVAVNEDFFVVGCRDYNGGQTDSGQLIVYTLSTNAELITLEVTTQTQPSAKLGSSVAIHRPAENTQDGSLIVAGATNGFFQSSQKGAIAVFEFVSSAWSLKQTIDDTDGNLVSKQLYYSDIGSSVALDNTYIMFCDATYNLNDGSCFLYNWTKTGGLTFEFELSTEFESAQNYGSALDLQSSRYAIVRSANVDTGLISSSPTASPSFAPTHFPTESPIQVGTPTNAPTASPTLDAFQNNTGFSTTTIILISIGVLFGSIIAVLFIRTACCSGSGKKSGSDKY